MTLDLLWDRIVRGSVGDRTVTNVTLTDGIHCRRGPNPNSSPARNDSGIPEASVGLIGLGPAEN